MHNSKSQPVTSVDVWKTWFPLALSWLMMGIELPLLSAVVARLANPEVNLGAYGGVVFPLSLLIEAPIIMLLTASTKLSRDLASYKKLWRFMMIAGGGLSALHLLVAITPLFDWLVGGLLGVEDDILEASRLGMIIMTPWTWAIAHRTIQPRRADSIRPLENRHLGHAHPTLRRRVDAVHLPRHGQARQPA